MPLARSTSAPRLREDLHHVVGVAEVRHAADDAFVPREQGGGEDGQGGVFGAADVDRAFEQMTAVNDEFIHEMN